MPVTPTHVQQLVEQGVKVVIQPSTRRIFVDSEYQKAGAVVQEDISEASVILGVKEVPVGDLIGDRTYMFFSHTIKAQPGKSDTLSSRYSFLVIPQKTCHYWMPFLRKTFDCSTTNALLRVGSALGSALSPSANMLELPDL